MWQPPQTYPGSVQSGIAGDTETNMKSLKRYLIDLLPLFAIAVIVAVAYPKFTATSFDRSHKIISAPESRELPQSEEYQVISVHDGDTITVQGSWGKQKIRLCGIDAPELEQPLGYESRDLARSLVDEAGNNIVLMPIEKDRYGRTVAEVFVVLKDGQEKSLQEELLKSGLAYVYEQYVSDCLNADPMRSAEAIARSKRTGVWSGSHVKPWDYRRQRR